MGLALKVFVGPTVVLLSNPVFALVEYAPEMRALDELRATSSSHEVHDNSAAMKRVSALTPVVEQESSAVHAASVGAAGAGTGSDSDSGSGSGQESGLSVSHEAARIDSASWTTGASSGATASEVIASSPLLKAILSAKLPLALEFATAPGANGKEEVLLRLHEGDLFIKNLSLTQDLAARTAQGALSMEEAAAIESEFVRLQGTVYKLPRSEQELKGALGFATETAIVPEDFPDLITVHLQLGLGTSTPASNYLVGVLSGLISNHN